MMWVVLLTAVCARVGRSENAHALDMSGTRASALLVFHPVCRDSRHVKLKAPNKRQCCLRGV